jgi:hypothetical protein
MNESNKIALVIVAIVVAFLLWMSVVGCDVIVTISDANTTTNPNALVQDNQGRWYAP